MVQNQVKFHCFVVFIMFSSPIKIFASFFPLCSEWNYEKQDISVKFSCLCFLFAGCWPISLCTDNFVYFNTLSLSFSLQILLYYRFIVWEIWHLKMCFRPHYSVNMTAVQVGHTFLSLSTDASDQGDGKGTIIDIGTTLAYLPDGIYEPLVYKVYKTLTFCKFTLQLHAQLYELFSLGRLFPSNPT